MVPKIWRPGSCIGALVLQHNSTLTIQMKCGIIRKMAKQNKDYGYDIQKLYPEMMLANAETFGKA